MQLIDTHCHLTFDAFDGQVEQVLQRSHDASVTSWITVGTTLDDSRKAVELAQNHSNLYAAVAVHPHDARTVTDEMMAELKHLAQSNKVVAIGETGLDFHYDFSKEADQKRVFGLHLQVAADLNLPVIIHCRKAFDDTLAILKDFPHSLPKVVFHCFSGSSEQAKILLDKGFYISFTGVVTFKNAEKTRKAALAVPPDRLMLETDCPYMSPEPVRKIQPNEPALLVHTARFLAELKQTPLDTLAGQTTATAKSFFNLH